MVKGKDQSPSSTGPEKIETGTGSLDFVKEAMKEQLSEIAPETLQAKITNEQIAKIVGNLANTYGMEEKHAYIAIILLFLKGAASSSTPPTLSVTILGREVTKRDLVNSYSLVTRNNFVRRLAEAMAEDIGYYAQQQGLHGELAKRIESIVLASGEPPLTSKEKAWCSSFSQAIDDLDKKAGSDRLTKLLHQDYDKRFGKKQKQSGNADNKSAPNKNQPQKGSNTKSGKKASEQTRNGKRPNSPAAGKKGQSS